MDPQDQPLDTVEEAAAVIAEVDGNPQHDETPPDAPSTEATSADQAPEESFTTFNLADVPEEYRPHVEAARRTMQADYTRKRQDEAAHRKFFEDRGIDPTDPAAAFQALAQELGYELDDEDPDADTLPDDLPEAGGFEDPVLARVERLEQERQAEQQQAADMTSLAEDLDYVRSKLGREPSEAEVEFFGAHAVRDNTGRLGIRDVFDRTEALMAERQKAYRATKQAPKVQAGGQAGVTARNLDDDEQRLQATAEILAQNIGPN